MYGHLESDPPPPGEHVRAEVVRRGKRYVQRRRAFVAAGSAVAVVGVLVFSGVLHEPRHPDTLAVRTPSPIAPDEIRSPEDSLALVGRWTVEAQDAPEGTIVKFGTSTTIYLPCGVLDGDWKADGSQGLFVGSVSGSDEGCLDTLRDRSFSWLTRATRFQLHGQDRLLLDAEGNTVAVLHPGAEPTVGPNRAGSYAEAPTITRAMRVAAREPAQLPAGVQPATQQDLARRWVPIGSNASNSKAYVAFAVTGEWQGSDGCNGTGGQFVLGYAGRLLATAGIQTAVACLNSPVAMWPYRAARVGLVGDHLAFYDAAGHELGQASPAAG